MKNQNKSTVNKLIKTCYKEAQNSLQLGKKSYQKKDIMTNWASIFDNIDCGLLNKLQIFKLKLNLAEMEVLATKQWSNLKELSFWSNNCEEIEWKKLMTIEFPSLSILKIQKNSLSDGSFLMITNKIWNNLVSLHLRGNQITSAGLRSMPYQGMANLTYLNLCCNQIGSTGTKVFSKIKLPNLKQMIIKYCNIGNQGITHITKGVWKTLQIIWINDNFIESDGYIVFSAFADIKNLKQITVGDFYKIDDEQLYKYCLSPTDVFNLIHSTYANGAKYYNLSTLNQQIMDQIKIIAKQIIIEHEQ